MLNPNLTQEQAVWLVEVFASKMNGRIDGKTMDTLFLPAREYIMGRKIEKPGCGCEYKAYAAMSKSMYGQHEAAIKEIAYPPKKVTKRGRKKAV